MASPVRGQPLSLYAIQQQELEDEKAALKTRVKEICLRPVPIDVEGMVRAVLEDNKYSSDEEVDDFFGLGEPQTSQEPEARWSE